MEKTIVLVTGVSTGLGRAFAKALLEAGYVVVGTVRKQEAVQEFESIAAERAFARVLDVTNGKRRFCPCASTPLSVAFSF